MKSRCLISGRNNSKQNLQFHKFSNPPPPKKGNCFGGGGGGIRGILPIKFLESKSLILAKNAIAANSQLACAISVVTDEADFCSFMF